MLNCQNYEVAIVHYMIASDFVLELDFILLFLSARRKGVSGGLI